MQIVFSRETPCFCGVARVGLIWKFQYIPRIAFLSLTKLFPAALLVCNVGAAICCAMAGDYRRCLYWAASALCIGAITF